MTIFSQSVEETLYESHQQATRLPSLHNEMVAERTRDWGYLSSINPLLQKHQDELLKKQERKVPFQHDEDAPTMLEILRAHMFDVIKQRNFYPQNTSNV